MPGWHPQFLADQLTLFQLGGADYAHHITTGTSNFLHLPASLYNDTYQTVVSRLKCLIPFLVTIVNLGRGKKAIVV